MGHSESSCQKPQDVRAFVSVAVLFKPHKAVKRCRHFCTSVGKDAEVDFFGKRCIVADQNHNHLWNLCSANTPNHQELEKIHAPHDTGAHPTDEWRPHSILNDDSIDDLTDQIPLELVEGCVENDVTRFRFDLDADETMIMLRLRRNLHQDDAKRIFDNPRVGDM